MSETPSKDWIQTFTGKAFQPLNPDPSLICLEDIAHALSMQCRFTGHVRKFYSVAEHSVRVMWEVERALVGQSRGVLYCPTWFEKSRLALLHDATEAYLIDLARPVKRQAAMEPFRRAEFTIEGAVCEHFGFTVRPSEDPDVNQADLVLCNAERMALMGKPPHPWGEMPDARHIDVKGIGWPPERAEWEFLYWARVRGIK